jgi:pimeloyl-ACP methyl ester carboxylesterase
LSELKVPTFIIVGERDVPDIQRLVDRVVAEVPGARKAVIPGAGHIVNMEQPVEFNRALLQILKTGE